MDKNKQFIAYYRVSTDRQGKSGLGLEAQTKAVKRYLKAYWPPEASFTEVESGKNNQRPELDKTLKLCKKLKATLVVAKLDRLSRDLHFITSLDKAKIKFICCDMPEANNLTINLMRVLAEWERKQISKRTKEALKALKARGKKLGSNNPKTRVGLKKYWKDCEKQRKKKARELGKQKQARKKEKKETKTSLFDKSMVEKLRLLSHLSIREITNELIEKQIQNRRGDYSWNRSSVFNLIKRLEKRGYRIRK